MAGAVDSDTSSDQAGNESTERSRVPAVGGVLMYESRDVGRELVGFEEVTDWDLLGDAVAARGYSRGDMLHLPEPDESHHDQRVVGSVSTGQ